MSDVCGCGRAHSECLWVRVMRALMRRVGVSVDGTKVGALPEAQRGAHRTAHIICMRVKCVVRRVPACVHALIYNARRCDAAAAAAVAAAHSITHTA